MNKNKTLNQLKNITKNMILSMFNSSGHNVKQIELEAVAILFLKKLIDENRVEINLLSQKGIKQAINQLEDKGINCNELSVFGQTQNFVTGESTDEIAVIKFLSEYSLIMNKDVLINSINYLELLKVVELEDFCSYSSIQAFVDSIINTEINNQMSKVMNAVKGLRQDLYQNDFVTGSGAYRETVRVLFIKMVLDKEVKEGKIDKRFHDFKSANLRESMKMFKTMPGNESKTETEYLNERLFRKDILNIGNKSPYPIYENLFRKDEKIVSSPTMIYKFIGKVEDVDFTDLMDYGKDILGIVYETFIGEVQNADAGQIFTPTDVVEFMGDIVEITMDDIALDFCSGSGRFMTSSMRRMIFDAREKITDKKERDEKIAHIKANQVYGSDVGSDPTLNTKRNMALAGDGSSHVANMNSLFIETTKKGDDIIAKFINGKDVNKDEVVGIDGDTFEMKNCSVILTNPPFGDLTIKETYSAEWVDKMRNTFNDASWSELKRWIPKLNDLIGLALKSGDAEQYIDKIDEMLDRAPVDRKDTVDKKFVKLVEAINQNDEKKAIKVFKELIKKGQRLVSTEFKEKKGQRVLTGRKELKGCLLFLYKAYEILKVGGRTAIIVDDGVLNTDTYAFARDFIRNKFFIKGVFSLSDKAFYAFSDKTIKTSILLLEKKQENYDEDGDIQTELQVEPTFYAHIEKVGINSKRGKYESHFPEVKKAYFEFVKQVNKNKAKNSGIFNSHMFEFLQMDIETIQLKSEVD